LVEMAAAWHRLAIDDNGASPDHALISNTDHLMGAAHRGGHYD
jgi:hypothetical protein